MQIQIALGSQPAKTFTEAALVTEVRTTLQRWLRLQPSADRGVLIGGLALAFYARPRQTMDIDLMFADERPIEVPSSFKRVRPHAVMSKDTHVELEFVTPKLIGIPAAIARKVVDTAVDIDGFKVASLEAMIALKLYGADNMRRRRRDEADILDMLENNRHLDIEKLIEDWHLSDEHAKRLMSIYEDAGA